MNLPVQAPLPTDGWPTQTTTMQASTEADCTAFFLDLDEVDADQIAKLQAAGFLDADRRVCLLHERHESFLIRGLEYLPPGFQSMDASRPWFIYWILHALEVLGEDVGRFGAACLNTIKRCWSDALGGGFGGGILQMGHMATTYACCLALAIIGTPEAYDIVDRPALLDFFLRHKDPASGAFQAHDEGEVDVRITYCVISIASLFGILTPELTAGVIEFVAACQTYEGGFGPMPYQEAHGGYTFSGAAILSILNALDRVNLPALTHYVAHRQMAVEGGYQGRTNKLVDGCYSFWMGSVPALIASHTRGVYVSDRAAHQRYILLCCQQLEGGLRDKPGKARDHYHSCYVLSGLSLSQHGDGKTPVFVAGSPENRLEPTHPAYNICPDKVLLIQSYFADKAAGRRIEVVEEMD
ncbi:prenyltransferase-like protein [Achlya hypogyna]|uniref:Protein farnesyltransferase subunit beta n=1 Tax=Achlya hypogyna TaxID=1202772 RepID=A0A1V9YBB4_ACHHY|nr:prenyltransferase-like protein [Achlya hypogyna]